MAQQLTDAIRAYIGMETGVLTAGEPVERGAVRRFAQAVMDPDPAYADAAHTGATRYGAPVAPPMFPVTMLHPALGAPDLIAEHASEPDFDGLIEASAMGLPPLPLVNSPQLNAGAAFEMLRLARQGETIRVQSRYRDIFEREISRGRALFVVIETDFTDADGALICRFSKTLIRS
ncbi:MAG: FAS1-like dehydratase domain-containing protein [Burkholderiales bacterium]